MNRLEELNLKLEIIAKILIIIMAIIGSVCIVIITVHGQAVLNTVTLKFVKDSQPVTDMLVEVYDANGTLVFKGFTDANGTVQLSNVAEGNYTVKAYLKNEFLNTLVEYKFSTEITAGQTLYEFDLSLSESWKNINWRPLLIVAGLGILGFLILFGLGYSVVERSVRR